jgi:hypothetical protein
MKMKVPCPCRESIVIIQPISNHNITWKITPTCREYSRWRLQNITGYTSICYVRTHFCMWKFAGNWWSLLCSPFNVMIKLYRYEIKLITIHLDRSIIRNLIEIRQIVLEMKYVNRGTRSPLCLLALSTFWHRKAKHLARNFTRNLTDSDCYYIGWFIWRMSRINNYKSRNHFPMKTKFYNTMCFAKLTRRQPVRFAPFRQSVTSPAMMAAIFANMEYHVGLCLQVERILHLL